MVPPPFFLSWCVVQASWPAKTRRFEEAYASMLWVFFAPCDVETNSPRFLVCPPSPPHIILGGRPTYVVGANRMSSVV